MAGTAIPPFSYRDDPAVPAFDDSKPVFVFDGVCAMCSTGVSWIMRHDPQGRVHFLSAQSPAGQALYRHYGMVLDDSYLLISDGRARTASAGFLELARILGGRWRLFRAFGLVPAIVRDAGYRLIARHRYRWFGKTEFCALLSEEQRQRLL